MTTIRLTPELEQVMAEEARLRGTTVEVLALDRLNVMFLGTSSEITISDGETMKDYLADFIGSVDSREVVSDGANMSEYTGRQLGKILKKKHRAGRLSPR